MKDYTYAQFMEKSDKAMAMAIEYYRKSDIALATFYKNVSEGFKIKALRKNVYENL